MSSQSIACAADHIPTLIAAAARSGSTQASECILGSFLAAALGSSELSKEHGGAHDQNRWARPKQSRPGHEELLFILLRFLVYVPWFIKTGDKFLIKFEKKPCARSNFVCDFVPGQCSK